jgi:hypothetical protein
MIKIEIKNTNNFFLKGEIEKKNQFNKRPEKKIKKIKTELKIIIYDRLELKNKIKKQLQRNQEQKLEIKKLKLK